VRTRPIGGRQARRPRYLAIKAGLCPQLEAVKTLIMPKHVCVCGDRVSFATARANAPSASPQPTLCRPAADALPAVPRSAACPLISSGACPPVPSPAVARLHPPLSGPWQHRGGDCVNDDPQPDGGPAPGGLPAADG
jgi:hypothetical protein